MPIIRERVRPDSIVYTDSIRAYDTRDVSEFRHRRVNHSKTFVSKRGHHINGIENFWKQAKRHMRRFNGIRKESFYWYLTECEWRFNGGPHQRLLRQLKQRYQSAKHELLATSAPTYIQPFLTVGYPSAAHTIAKP